MFCPLCRAEYRDGFAHCSDCHVELESKLDGLRSSRAQLWKGDRQEKLDRILRALDEADVPCHFKAIVNTTPKLNILGIPIGPQRSTFEYEVWIFHHDLERARAAIGVD